MNEIFRPRSNIVIAGVSFVLIALFAVNSVLVTMSPVQILLELLACLIMSGIVFAIWIRPKLVLSEEIIEVVNPLRSERIPYSDVQSLDTKWALTITHKRGKTSVWVAPASGKRRWIADTTFGWYGHGIPLSEARSKDSETMSQSLNSFSGQAAYLIQERIKRLH